MKMLSQEENPDFTIEQLKVMKDSVGAFPFVPYLHGVVIDMIDGKWKEKAPLSVVKQNT
jgi:hypothetical protein